MAKNPHEDSPDTKPAPPGHLAGRDGPARQRPCRGPGKATRTGFSGRRKGRARERPAKGLGRSGGETRPLRQEDPIVTWPNAGRKRYSSLTLWGSVGDAAAFSNSPAPTLPASHEKRQKELDQRTNNPLTALDPARTERLSVVCVRRLYGRTARRLEVSQARARTSIEGLSARTCE
jgi:hypothetical protein